MFSTKIFLGLFFLLLTISAASQEVYTHISNTGIYTFLDELAALKVIDVNSAVKPYSRKKIADHLNEALKNDSLLNKRMKKELSFYLKDYNKELIASRKYDKKRLDLFYYKDSLFTLSINPILGFESHSALIEEAYRRYNGAEMFSYIGKRIGIYASLRDNHESVLLARPEYITLQQGPAYKKLKDGSADYSEARGGITYSWSFGSVGLMKDHFVWGNNYHGSNIFSGKQPSFPYINFSLTPVKWLDFHYIHGWLVSNVIDSTKSYKYPNGQREFFYNKYLAANLITISALKKLKFSFGNSIIYSSENVQWGYLVPFLFYKSVDHSSNGRIDNVGQNSQLFFDVSYRPVKKVHVYSSLFVDEISIKRMWKSEEHTNFLSVKSGIQWINFLPNTSVQFEYTLNNPMTYQHYIPTLTFKSNNYTLGSYLPDNADEYFASISYKPIYNLQFTFAYVNYRVAKPIEYTGIGMNGLGNPILKNIVFSNQNCSIRVNYQPINDVYLFFQGGWGKTSGDDQGLYIPKLYQGNVTSLLCGVNIGF